MAVVDGSVNTGASGNPIRVLTGVGAGGAVDQQVVSLARSDGTLEATSAAGSIAVQSRVQALALTTGTITTPTGVVTATTDVANAGTITVGVYGTFVGAVLNFEASPDGTNWFPVLAQRTDMYEVEIGGVTPAFSLTAQARAWDIPLPGFTQFRVRATALTSGTVNVIISPAVNGFEVAPTVGLAAVPMFEVTASTTSATTIFTQDCLNFASVRIGLSGTWVGTVVWENSNDGATWNTMFLQQGASNGALISSATFNSVFYGNINARYLRARCTSLTSGTIITTAEFSPQNLSPYVTYSTLSNATTASTLADGSVNPSVGQIGVDSLLFNGSTWDRARNNLNTTTGDTGAKTTTFNGATQTNYNACGATVLLNVGTVSGTSPTLVATLQESPDGGTTWINIPGATTASLTATGVYAIKCYPAATPVAGTATTGSVAAVSQPLPRTWRVVYTIGGTSPSFTLTNVQVAYIN